MESKTIVMIVTYAMFGILVIAFTLMIIDLENVSNIQEEYCQTLGYDSNLEVQSNFKCYKVDSKGMIEYSDDISWDFIRELKQSDET